MDAVNNVLIGVNYTKPKREIVTDTPLPVTSKPKLKTISVNSPSLEKMQGTESSTSKETFTVASFSQVEKEVEDKVKTNVERNSIVTHNNREKNTKTVSTQKLEKENRALDFNNARRENREKDMTVSKNSTTSKNNEEYYEKLRSTDGDVLLLSGNNY
ncbi:MAG: hypothetical protein ACK5LY_11100 [Lachnospirales bacterium]